MLHCLSFHPFSAHMGTPAQPRDPVVSPQPGSLGVQTRSEGGNNRGGAAAVSVAGWGWGPGYITLPTGDDGISVLPGTENQRDHEELWALDVTLVVSAPSRQGLRLGSLGFRWLRIPGSFQVSSWEQQWQLGPWVWAGRSPGQWPARDSAGAICVALRPSLGKVQVGSFRTQCEMEQAPLQEFLGGCDLKVSTCSRNTCDPGRCISVRGKKFSGH